MDFFVCTPKGCFYFIWISFVSLIVQYIYWIWPSYTYVLLPLEILGSQRNITFAMSYLSFEIQKEYLRAGFEPRASPVNGLRSRLLDHQGPRRWKNCFVSKYLYFARIFFGFPIRKSVSDDFVNQIVIFIKSTCSIFGHQPKIILM